MRVKIRISRIVGSYRVNSLAEPLELDRGGSCYERGRPRLFGPSKYEMEPVGPAPSK